MSSHQKSPSITVSKACLTYQGTLLFKDLNLTLPAEHWTCLLGPSGVGKTSLLRLIADLTSGATVEGAITASDQLPLAGRIAYMAQQDLLMPWYSALDNVLIGMRLRNEKSQTVIHRAQAEFLLEKVGLKDALYKYPAELSGGMRQRVALARTLMENKPIVLMDEPFAAVDAITRLRLQELAAELLRHRTVLLVTHDPLEALRLADQIFVMAGLPARLGKPFVPPEQPPRNMTDPALLQMEVELLRQLARENTART